MGREGLSRIRLIAGRSRCARPLEPKVFSCVDVSRAPSRPGPSPHRPCRDPRRSCHPPGARCRCSRPGRAQHRTDDHRGLSRRRQCSATYNADFVELYNASAAPISLAGKSIQYRASTNSGVPTNVYALPDVNVPSHSYFLLSGSTGANGVAFPRPADVSTGRPREGAPVRCSWPTARPASSPPPLPGAHRLLTRQGDRLLRLRHRHHDLRRGHKTGTITTAGSYKRATLVDADNNNTDFTGHAASVGAVAPTTATARPRSPEDHRGLHRRRRHGLGPRPRLRRDPEHLRPRRSPWPGSPSSTARPVTPVPPPSSRR